MILDERNVIGPDEIIKRNRTEIITVYEIQTKQFLKTIKHHVRDVCLVLYTRGRMRTDWWTKRERFNRKIVGIISSAHGVQRKRGASHHLRNQKLHNIYDILAIEFHEIKKEHDSNEAARRTAEIDPVYFPV